MYTKDDMIEMLKSYRSNARVIRQLEFELSQVEVMVTQDDIIHSLAITPPDGEGVATGRISDRTFSAAIRFQEETAVLRQALRGNLARELAARTVHQKRLEHYVGLLEDDLRVVVTEMYFLGHPADKIAQSIGITPKGVSLRRNRAAILLAEMFNRVKELL